ncbi:MAG TPA: c-type cytochrome [Luteitalea sp.]|nr:c-type cytochrome [Luteitalea sp.]
MMRGLASLAALFLCGAVVTVAGQAPQGPPASGPGGPPQGGPPGGGPRFTPPTPKNLQVLPKDMDGRQVVAIMRNFNQALGVRCVYCHVPGANEQDLSTFDFASDDKAHKKAAREMLTYTMRVNDGFPPGLGEDLAAGERRVTCWTCHRGDKQPQTRRPEGPGGPGGPAGPSGPGAAVPGAPPPQGTSPAQPPPGTPPRPPAA